MTSYLHVNVRATTNHSAFGIRGPISLALSVKLLTRRLSDAMESKTVIIGVLVLLMSLLTVLLGLAGVPLTLRSKTGTLSMSSAPTGNLSVSSTDSSYSTVATIDINDVNISSKPLCQAPAAKEVELMALVPKLLGKPPSVAAAFVAQVMASSSIRHMDLRPWRRVLSKPTGSKINVIAFGGSMTAGTDCLGRRTPPDLECAYPGRLKHLLQSSFPDFHFFVENVAKSGINSKMAVSFATTYLVNSNISWDIAIVDHHVNDVLSEQVDRDSTGAITEVLITTIRRLVPGVAVISLIPSLLPGDPFANAVCAEANLAHVNQRTFVLNLRLVSEKMRLVTWFPPDKGHPLARTHKLIAHLLHIAIHNIRSVACGHRDQETEFKSYSFPGAEEHSKCTHPVISAYAPPPHWTVNSSTADQGWRYVVDRHGPGWVAQRGGTSISFEVRLKAPKSFVTIAYLRSGSPMGNAELFLTDASNPLLGPSRFYRRTGFFMLHGHWARNFTVPSTAQFHATVREDGLGMRPGSVVNVTLVSRPVRHAVKFKLLSIAVC